MKVILFSSKHGATRKVGKILNEYLGDCLLMDIQDVDYQALENAEMIIIGTPVYYRKLNQDIVNFVKSHQELLIAKKYCLYIIGILPSEFMSFVTESFNYQILKNIKIIAGFGGVLYYPELSISEKMILQVMNKRSPFIGQQKNKDLFQNINDEEIKIYADKIKRIL